jgi:hypothetical protein
MKEELNLIDEGVDLGDILVADVNEVLHHPRVLLDEEAEGLDCGLAVEEVVDEDCPRAHLLLVLGLLEDEVHGLEDLQVGVAGEQVVEDLALVVGGVAQLEQGEALVDQVLLVVPLRDDLEDLLNQVQLDYDH